MEPIFDDEEFEGPEDSQSDDNDHHHHSRHKPKGEIHLVIGKRFLIWTLVLLVLAGAGYGSWKMDAYAKFSKWYNAASINFKVLEKNTHQAVAGATVTAEDKTATSDDQGSVAVNGLTSGVVDLKVTKDGYVDRDVQLHLYRGVNPLDDVILDKAPDKMVNIAGTVSDIVSGAGLADVKVGVADQTLKSDTSGKFTLSAKFGVSKISFAKDGYAPLVLDIKMTGEIADPVTAEMVPLINIVFPQEKSSKTDLYSTDLVASAVTQITDGKQQYDNSNPLLSPDQKWLVFLSDRDGMKQNGLLGDRLYVRDSKGNIAKTTEDLNPREIHFAGNNIVTYVYTSKADMPSHDSLVAYNLDTKKRIPLDSAITVPSDQINSIYHSAISSDGKTVAFTLTASTQATGATNTSLQGIYVVNIDGTGGKRISTLGADKTINYILFADINKTLRVGLSDANSNYSIHTVNIASGEDKDISSSLLPYDRAYTRSKALTDSNGTFQLNNGSFVYIDTHNGAADVYSSDASGKNEVQITKLGNVENMVLSSDQKYLLVANATPNVAPIAIYIVGVGGGTAKKITDAFDFNVSFAQP